MKYWHYIALGLGGFLLLSAAGQSALVNTAIGATKFAFGNLSSTQQNSIKAIVKAYEKYGDGDASKLAYIIATAWHESRLKPVRECFANSDTEARQCVASLSYGSSINGYVYYGRGFIQLTWLENYIKMANVLGVDLVNNPDLALNTNIAAKILVYGMYNGSFTGKKLSDYIDTSLPYNDFYNARRIVNGLDRAQLINDYAISLTQYRNAA
jgi:predicted chitinase